MSSVTTETVQDARRARIRSQVDAMPLDQVAEALAALERARLVPRLTRYIPHAPTPRQAAFLLLDDLEAFYGGAAGGGKSDALLMAALQYVDAPGYAAVIFRRTFTDLSLPDALIPRSHEWLANTDARWDPQLHQWTFPSGATLTFAYMDSEWSHLRYQSAAFTFVAFDEVTQFRADQYVYLFSRLRKPEGLVTPEGRPIPLRMRSAANPQPPGLEWVRARFVPQVMTALDGTRYVHLPKDEAGNVRPFVPSRLQDNPHLDQEAYLAGLQNLDPVTRQRLLDGNWEVMQQGGIFRREWWEGRSGAILLAAPPDVLRWVRHWDFAASGKEGDWAASCLMGERPAHASGPRYVIGDIHRLQGGPADVEAAVKAMARIDGRSVHVTLEQEPGSAGKAQVSHYVRNVLPGWTVKGRPPTGSKEVRAGPLASQSEQGNVAIVRGPTLGAFLEEANAFPFGDHDDMVDAATGAFAYLTEEPSKMLRSR